MNIEVSTQLHGLVAFTLDMDPLDTRFSGLKSWSGQGRREKYLAPARKIFFGVYSL
jgi:hypothetical protein